MGTGMHQLKADQCGILDLDPTWVYPVAGQLVAHRPQMPGDLEVLATQAIGFRHCTSAA
jgi:hypothetical protein